MAKNFEIIFNLDRPITTINDEKHLFSLDEVKEILDNHKGAKYIIAKHPIDKMSKFNHLHVGIHTGSDNTYSTIGKWFNLKPNSVQSIGKKFESTYALYLEHFNQDEKSRIDTKDIFTNFDLDYETLHKNIEKKANDDLILDKLARGDISEFDLFNEQDETWCRKNLKRIQDALVVRSKKFMVKGEKREMEVIFITGEPRCGKTYLAERLCRENGYSVYKSSSGEHPFDDYMGQDAVILDDLRPDNFKFNEFLRIIDNHNLSSKVSARYHNIDLNCKIIYITSILTLEKFYEQLQKDYPEAKAQLYGRIGTKVFVNKEYVSFYALNDDNLTYSCIIKDLPNPILSDDEVKKMSVSKKREMLLNACKGLGDLSNYLVNEVTQLKIDDDLPFD